MTGVSTDIRRSFSTADCLNTVKRGSGKEEISNKVLNIKAVSNLKNLVVAYELIKSKPGNMTPGLDPSTLDGINLVFLEKVKEKLRGGKYQFPPARIIDIPKPGKPN